MFFVTSEDQLRQHVYNFQQNKCTLHILPNLQGQCICQIIYITRVGPNSLDVDVKVFCNYDEHLTAVDSVKIHLHSMGGPHPIS